jgi:hypothetical protein
MSHTHRFSNIVTRPGWWCSPGVRAICYSVISQLYHPLSKQCSVCGLRFVDPRSHASHLDWHFEQNDHTIIRSREWFPIKSGWATKHAREPVRTTRRRIHERKGTDPPPFVVPTDEDKMECRACGEVLDPCWDDELEAWIVRDVTRTSEGLVHARCIYGLRGREPSAKRSRHE